MARLNALRLDYRHMLVVRKKNISDYSKIENFEHWTDVTSPEHGQKGLPKDYWLLRLKRMMSTISKWCHFIQNLQMNLPYIHIKQTLVMERSNSIYV